MFSSKSKYTVQWFRSILLLLFPCLLLCVVLCAYMMHISKKNVLEMNSAITRHVQKNMDSRLTELNRYALTIDISSHNTVLKNLNAYPETMPKQAYQLTDTLRDYLIANSFIENTYIYYPKSNLVVGSSGCFSSEAYYTLQNYPDSSGCQSWLQVLNSAEGMSIQDLSFRERQNISFIHKMETDHSNAAIMVFEIDYSQLLRDFDPSATVDALSIGILAKEHLTASVGNTDSLNTVDDLYRSWKESGENIIRRSDTYAFFYPSFVPGLTYVTVYTAGQLLKSLYFPLAAALTGVFLCAVIGIAGAVCVSVRNGRPMENLLAALGKKSNSEDDDYQFILHKFEQMTEEKYKSEELMRKHQTLLNSIFLSTLLLENFQNENEVFAKAKHYEVSLEASIYQVLILASPEEQAYDYALEAGALLDYLDQTEYSSLLTVRRAQYVILFNTDEPIPQHELRQMIETLRSLAFPGSPTLAAVGNRCDNMAEILSSYRNALTALRTADFPDGSGIVYYTETNEAIEPGNTDLMKLFSSLIYSKEFLKARQLLVQLNSEYLYHENVQTEVLRLNALTNLLIDAACTMLSQPQAAKEADALIKSADSRENFLTQADSLLKTLEKSAASQNASKDSIAAQAKQYIDEHFTDPMLGLYLVSDQLGTSNSYLSATFKKVYGVNVVQYINQLRIEQAKILILNTRRNIKEIAQEVGFSSDINFIRVFKKMENQTPTMLRKQTAPGGSHTSEEQNGRRK